MSVSLRSHMLCLCSSYVSFCFVMEPFDEEVAFSPLFVQQMFVWPEVKAALCAHFKDIMLRVCTCHTGPLK